MQPAFMTGLLCNKLSLFLPAVPVCEVISCVEPKFELIPVLVLESFRALVDAGLLIVLEDGIGFSEAVTCMLGAFVDMFPDHPRKDSLDQQPTCGSFRNRI